MLRTSGGDVLEPPARASGERGQTALL